MITKAIILIESISNRDQEHCQNYNINYNHLVDFGLRNWTFLFGGFSSSVALELNVFVSSVVYLFIGCRSRWHWKVVRVRWKWLSPWTNSFPTYSLWIRLFSLACCSTLCTFFLINIVNKSKSAKRLLNFMMHLLIYSRIISIKFYALKVVTNNVNLSVNRYTHFCNQHDYIRLPATT